MGRKMAFIEEKEQQIKLPDHNFAQGLIQASKRAFY
jgi:hypothetical protein